MAISDIVGRTVNDFADYAIAIVTIMLIYYAIKFFMVAPPTKEDRKRRQEEDERNKEEFRHWTKEKWEKHKRNEEERKKKVEEENKRYHREKRVRVVLSSIVNAFEGLSKLSSCLNDVKNSNNKDKRNEALTNAKKYITEIHKHLHTSNRLLKREMNHSQGEEHKYFYTHWAESGSLITLLENIQHQLPVSTLSGPEWGDKIKTIIDDVSIGGASLKGLKSDCDLLIGELNKYVEVGHQPS